jgi:hypothetical protein
VANSTHITTLPGLGRGAGRGVAFPPLDGEWKPAVSCMFKQNGQSPKHLTGHIRIRNNTFRIQNTWQKVKKAFFLDPLLPELAQDGAH